MSRDTRIGCMADFDLNQYHFQRSSGLPRGYFDRQPVWRYFQWAFIAALALALLAAILLTRFA